MSQEKTVKQYDDYAPQYEKWTQLPLRKYAWRETVLKNLPDLSNKKLLDLACGTGTSTELLEIKGAKEIVGIDSSEEQLKIFCLKFPRMQTIRANLIEYDLSLLGKFDVVTAIYLFEYFQNRNDIEQLIQNIASVLTPKSEFYGLTIDQIAVASQKDYYGITGPLPTVEGEAYVDMLPDGEGNKFPVAMYHWPMLTLRNMFEENGFVVEELPVFVAPEGIEKYGEGYWGLFLEKPIYKIFRARPH